MAAVLILGADAGSCTALQLTQLLAGQCCDPDEGADGRSNQTLVFPGFSDLDQGGKMFCKQVLNPCAVELELRTSVNYFTLQCSPG